MGSISSTAARWLPRVLVLLLLASPGVAGATTAADVCATAGNVCAGGEADINVATAIDADSVLDFATLGFGIVNVDAGGSLAMADVPNGFMEIIVDDLNVKGGGAITVDKTKNNAPGRLTVSASNNITVSNGGVISAIGGSGPPNPTIELFAEELITIAGLVEARGLTSKAFGGNIFIESQNNKVIVTGTGVVKANSTDPGGTLIEIKGCLGIDIFGIVDATAKKRNAQVLMLSRTDIRIIGGQVLADVNKGELFPGDPPIVHRIVLEARADITLESALVSANTGARTPRPGGNIQFLSTEGEINIDPATIIRATSFVQGGTITLRSLEDLTYGGLIEANGSGNNGVGGTILFQSFQQDVIGVNTPNVEATGSSGPGTITLRACVAAITNGGNFNPAAALDPNQCVAAPTSGVLFGGALTQFPGDAGIPVCVGCFCLNSFSVSGNTLTIKGVNLEGVQLVEFNNGCNPDVGGDEVAKAAFISQTETAIRVDLSAFNFADRNIILSSPAGPSSSCSLDTLTFP